MTTENKAIVGRNESVSFSKIAVDVPAKIDTGADSSSIWVSNLRVDKHGVLKFRLFGEGSPYYTGRVIKREQYTVASVKSSNGQEQIRYRTRLSLRLAGKRIRASFTLTDRSTQKFPVLIGRRTLKNKFIVDVSRETHETSPREITKTLNKKHSQDPYKFFKKHYKKNWSKHEESSMNIAILSNGNGNYSTKRLKEEAVKRGHTVKIIKYRDCYASIEKNRPTVRYRGEDLSQYDAVIPRIASHMTRYGTAIVRQLEMQGLYTLSSSIAIARSRDKLRSMQLLAKAGVGIPKTVFSRNSTDIDDLIETIGGMPVIIKLASGTHGNGVVLAETKKAAKSVLQAFYLTNEDGTNVLLQEFIKESAGTDIRAFVVGSRVVASMKRQSLDDDFRSNLHKGGEGVAIKLTEEERKMAVKAAKAMGLNIAGVDMMRSERGPLVLEVNASPGFGVEKITNRNVAGAIIEYVELNAKRANRKDKVGA